MLDYDKIKGDYEPNEHDDDRLRTVKERIQDLSFVERKILITYVELGTYSAAAREFNVSPPTLKTYVCNIMQKLKIEQL